MNDIWSTSPGETNGGSVCILDSTLRGAVSTALQCSLYRQGLLAQVFFVWVGDALQRQMHRVQQRREGTTDIDAAHLRRALRLPRRR